MKRDMDLIRKLLLKIESSETSYVDDFTIPDYSQAETDYHVELLISAGLVNSNIHDRTADGRFHAVADGLSWEGHDFLDAIRSDSVWDKTKSFIKDSGLQGIPFDLLKEAAISVVRERLGLG